MAGVIGASLGTLSNNKITRNTNSSGYIIYPSDMKDDTTKTPGQDRIEFGLYKYTKKLTGEQGPNIGQTIPFSTLLERNKESDNFERVPIKLSTKEETSLDRVFLPIQDKIQDNNSVSWGEGTLNDLQRRLANLSYSVMSSENPEVDKNLDSVKQFLTNSGDLGRLYMVEQAITVQNLFSRATGSILNPNVELLFEKPSLRPFTFNFKLSPRNENESVDVKRIIKFFKLGMAPRVASNNIFLMAPFLFKIVYHYGSKKVNHPGINKIKMCALQSCFTDYTPNNNYMTYRDGTMTSYVINLTFQELIPIYDEDYNDDHPIGY